MPYHELEFGLDRESKYASLAPQELKSLGKQASNMYLDGTCSLNDAVVKVARQHADISKAQVERVLEHANSETFLNIFEKQAGDKNVEFDLADPAVVFQALEKGASSSFSARDSDYAVGPVKTGRSVSNLEADITLARAFGVDLMKTANGDEESGGKSPSKGQVLQFLESSKNPTDDEFHDWAESKGLNVHKAEEKAYQLAAKQAQDLTGLADKEGLKPSDVSKKQLEMGKKVEMEHTKDPAVAEQVALDHLAEIPDYYTRLDEMEASAKKQKEAMVRIKVGDTSQMSPLEKAASLQTIRQMTGASPYPMSNPFGELFRTQQKMEKLAREAWVAAEKNSHLVKEAAGQLHRVVSNELLQGQDLGEIVHAMAHVADESWVKQAMAEVIPMLESRGFNLPSLRASLIRYDMEKSAGARAPNPENPVLQAFGAYVKLASEQPRLNEAFRQTQNLLGQVNDKVKEVMRSQYAG